MELITIRSLKNNLTWINLKGSFVIIGVLSTFPALATGEFVGENLEHTSKGTLIELHSAFASFATAVFMGLAVIYLILLIDNNSWVINKLKKISILNNFYEILLKVSRKLFIRPILSGVALLGLIFIILTGGLGGAIVYGPDVDPIVKFIYNLFF